MKQSFYGGVHPNDRKELARHKEVAPLSAAPKAGRHRHGNACRCAL